MQKYTNNFQDTDGRAIAGATVNVYTYPDGLMARLYETSDGGGVKGNPITTDDLGYFEFYAPNGDYTITITSPGTQPVTLSDVQLFDPKDGFIGDPVDADSYPSLQEALNSGRVIRLRDGKVYPVTTQLRIPAGSGIIGNGILLFNSDDFPATVKGVSATSVVLYALSVENITLRDFKMIGTCGVNSWIYPIALRDVRNADVWGIDVSGLNAGSMVLIDSSTDISVEKCFFHDSTLNRSISGGQLTAVETDDFRIGGVGSELINISSNSIRNLGWTPAFLAAYGPQTDGVNIKIGTKNYVVANNIMDGVGEGVDTFGDDGVIAGNIIKNALGYGVKLIHGASRNVVASNQIIYPGLGGIVIAGSSTASQNTDSNMIVGNLISGAGTNPGGYWVQPMYGIGVNNDGTFKAKDTLIQNNRVVNSSGANYAFQIASNGTGNVFDNNYSDGTPGAEFQGANATIYKPGFVGQFQPPGSTTTKYALTDTEGKYTQRFDAAQGATVETLQNFGIAAANNGLEKSWFFGKAGVSVGEAAREAIYATDTWADAAHASARYVLKLAAAGTSVNVLIVDPTAGVAAADLFSCDFRVSTVGKGLRVKEGSNAKQGVVTLTAGAATVANTAVTANSRIMLTSQADGGTPGFVRVSSRVAGTSFTITSSSGADASSVAYQIFEPA